MHSLVMDKIKMTKAVIAMKNKIPLQKLKCKTKIKIKFRNNKLNWQEINLGK